jgi:hypothetical protein
MSAWSRSFKARRDVRGVPSSLKNIFVAPDWLLPHLAQLTARLASLRSGLLPLMIYIAEGRESRVQCRPPWTKTRFQGNRISGIIGWDLHAQERD